jgi:hypothetical protein
MMDFIQEPKLMTRVKKEKTKEKTKYKVRGWVEDLMENPNRWAIYSRRPLDRQGMVMAYSSMDGYRKRYPHIEWAISKEDDAYAVCGRYTPPTEEG